MPTAQAIITNAATRLNIIDSGETLNSSELADCLDTLNALIDNYNSQELMATEASFQTVAMVSGTQSYALSTRLTKVVSASIVLSAGPTMPIEIVNAVRWNGIPDRDIQSYWVKQLFYDRGSSTGTVYLSPKPLGGTLTVAGWLAQSQFASLATNNTLLPGYLRLLQTQLALEIAPLFSRQPDAALVKSATEAKAEIAALNSSLMGDVPRIVVDGSTAAADKAV